MILEPVQKLPPDNHPKGPIESFHESTGRAREQWKRHGEGMEGLRAFHDSQLAPLAEQSRSLIATIDYFFKAAVRLIDHGEREWAAKENGLWNGREIGKARKATDAARHLAAEHLKQARYFQQQAAWLIERFPEAELVNVPGLCRIVSRADIEAADWRGGQTVQVVLGSARGSVSAHQQKWLGVALNYPGEDADRYLVATEMSWRALYPFHW